MRPTAIEDNTNSMKKISKTELPGFVQEMLKRLEGVAPEGRAALVTLRGDLGAGKTTLVQMLAKELGVEGPVQSPTYVIMKTYECTHPRFKTLVHIDAYRFDEPAQWAVLRPHEFINDSHTIVCIEWPERLEGALPAPDLTLNLSSEGASEYERFIEVV